MARDNLPTRFGITRPWIKQSGQTEQVRQYGKVTDREPYPEIGDSLLIGVARS